jgi:hypothetical protein
MPMLDDALDDVITADAANGTSGQGSKKHLHSRLCYPNRVLACTIPISGKPIA